MPIYIVKKEIWFPDPENSESDIAAVGGDLSPERLVAAYQKGIFPWYDDPKQILWWNPLNRCVLFLNELKVSKSMRNILNRKEFTFTFDKDFRGVMEGCREGERVGETWILDEVIESYCKLHDLGIAHSVEVWKGKDLVGGLYGVVLGHVFFGESMFSRMSNASKFGFIHLCRNLEAKGWKFVDCQIYNDHLGSLGAREIPRKDFLDMLQIELKYPTLQGKWKV